jgi:predicted NBD/HSP70 family sugar kinase
MDIEFVVITLIALLLDSTRVKLTTIDLNDEVLVRVEEVNPPTASTGPGRLSNALRKAPLTHKPAEQAFRFALRERFVTSSCV